MSKDRTSFSDNTRPTQAPSNGNNRSTGSSNGNTTLRQRRPRSQLSKNPKGRGSSEKCRTEALNENTNSAKNEATNEATTPVRGAHKADGSPRSKSQAKAANDVNSGDDKFSGSSFYLSPNAASLPRPPFSKPPSPPQVQMQPNHTNITPPQSMGYPPYLAYPPMMQLNYNAAPMMYPPGPMRYPMGPPPTMGSPMPQPFGPHPMYALPPTAIHMQQPSAN